MKKYILLGMALLMVCLSGCSKPALSNEQLENFRAKTEEYLQESFWLEDSDSKNLLTSEEVFALVEGVEMPSATGSYVFSNAERVAQHLPQAELIGEVSVNYDAQGVIIVSIGYMNKNNDNINVDYNRNGNSTAYTMDRGENGAMYEFLLPQKTVVVTWWYETMENPFTHTSTSYSAFSEEARSEMNSVRDGEKSISALEGRNDVVVEEIAGWKMVVPK